MCLHMKSVILLFVGIAESKYLFLQRYENMLPVVVPSNY